MTEQKKFALSLGARMSSAYCMHPPDELTAEQLSALHLCKHEIISALFRLYMTVPREIADKLVGDYVKPPQD